VFGSSTHDDLSGSMKMSLSIHVDDALIEHASSIYSNGWRK